MSIVRRVESIPSCLKKSILIFECRFPYDEYGSIVWDTHTYTPGSYDLDVVLGFYEIELLPTIGFQNRQGAPLIIGEFAFSNLK